jgi:hypothetical protein
VEQAQAGVYLHQESEIQDILGVVVELLMFLLIEEVVVVVLLR